MTDDPTPLSYQCQRCGNCCRAPGDVRISGDEITAIAGHLSLTVDEFIARFTRLRHDRSGLSIDDHPDGTCIFLEGTDCTIQPVKPAQCAGFPNTWRYPGWRQNCAAVPVRIPAPDTPKDRLH